MRKIKLILILFLFVSYAIAEEPIDHSILVNTEIDTTAKTKLIVNWKREKNAKQFIVKRKLLNENKWSVFIPKLDSNATGFIDSTIDENKSYEYFIKRVSIIYTDTTNYYYDGYSYIASGVNVKISDNRGRLLLLVDSTIIDSLKKEIRQFEMDLVGDGWNLVRYNVARTEKFDADAVQKVKQIIVNEFKNNPDSLNALIILGRVAVPYSGDLITDGHKNHQGAWVADTYYGDINGIWTDNTIDDTVADRKANWNIPGDGKFDQSQIPSDIDIMTGRIDFYNVKYFKISEIELYRKYLRKNHNFRHNIIKPKFKAVVDDNFGMYGEVFASDGWINFNALLGSDSVSEGDAQMPLDNEPLIWVYGCGAGSNYGIEKTVSLYDLDSVAAGGIFSMLFGSYNGDWDNKDNILLSVLAYTPYALTCSWSGRPFWHYHQLALGLPIGYCAKISQNNQILYETDGLYGYRSTQVSLLGDPSLRMYNETPISNLYAYAEISYDSNKVFLSWDVDKNNLIACNVYRAKSIYDKFEKINNAPVSNNSFVDHIPSLGNNIYMVRAIRKRLTKSASLINLSQGIFISVDIPKLAYASFLHYSLRVYPNPASDVMALSYIIPKEENVEITIWDSQGKFVKQLINKILYPRIYISYWDLTDSNGKKVQSGAYFARLKTTNKTIVVNLRVIY